MFLFIQLYNFVQRLLFVEQTEWFLINKNEIIIIEDFSVC